MLCSGRLVGVMILGLSVLSTPGCGGGPGSAPAASDAQETNALAELAEAYRAYSIAKKQPPGNLADLTSVESLGGNGVAAVKAGEILVRWGAKLPDTGEEPGRVSSPEVLAYGKQVPERGGYVLLLDRTVKKMTADEFKAAPKAPGKAEGVKQ
jgi:hypothetical protein